MYSRADNPTDERVREIRALPRTPDKDGDPRVVGGRYYCGYWGQEYTVLTVNVYPSGTKEFTEATDGEIERGETRTHITPWDHYRDRVIHQPS